MEKTMMDYIIESKDILSDIVDHSKEYTNELVDFYLGNSFNGISFVASGSSNNGTRCAVSLIRKVLKKDVGLYSPMNFYYHDHEYAGNTMIIGVSQSGCSTNTINALKLAKEEGHKVACLVGRDDCDVKDIADLTINWKVGEEKVGFVTKGVSSLACFLMCFALELGLKLGTIDDKEYAYYKDEMNKALSLMPEMIDEAKRVFESHKECFLDRDKIYLLSSGPNMGTISEAALKIAETSCIVAMAYEAEEYIHGPIYPGNPDDLVISIDNNSDESSKRINAIAKASEDITAKVFAITNDTSFDDEHAFRTSIETDCLVSPLYKLVCIQTLACLMTEATNKYKPHENVLIWKKGNKVASKSRGNLYLNLQER